MRSKHTAFIAAQALVVIGVLLLVTLPIISSPQTVVGGADCPATPPPSSLASNPYDIPFTLVRTPSFTPGSGIQPGTYCTYSEDGTLSGAFVADQVDGITASADGAYAVGITHSISSGPAGSATGGYVLFFNREGKIEWTIPTLKYSVEINGNGSVIIANDPSLAYIDNQGKVIWNYSSPFDSTAVALVDNGTEVVDGITNVPHYPYDGSFLVLFNSRGQPLWNATINDQIFDSTGSVAVGNGLVAAGLTFDGSNGTLFCYSLGGNLMWSKHLATAIQVVNFQDNGSQIVAQTNIGNLTLDDSGNVLANQTGHGL